MIENRRILVVDDERVMSDYLGDLLRQRHQVETVASAGEARALIAEKNFDVVLTDLQLEHSEGGLEVVRACRERGIPALVMTAYASMNTALTAMREGAEDFIAKPFGSVELERALERIGTNPASQPPPRPRPAGHGDGRKLILGKSEAMRRVYELAENVALTRATVMLTGESGTGKELVASAIHTLSRRSGSAFIKVNCAAITDTLLESTLFGHEKGAFTGAIKRTAGKFELANGGTLLLDEISEMRVELQSKLLRVLQEKEFELVGGTKTIPVDVRIIATSNRDIKDEVRKGKFREDLFFRLNVVPMHLPPLRERKDDIPDLVEHFLTYAALENSLRRPSISDSLMLELASQSWPGNVRQLQNAVERAVVMCRSDELIIENFLLDEDMHGRNDNEVAFNQDLTLKEMERRMIMATLTRFRENRTQAARHLGISVRTLRNKLNLYRQQGRAATA